MTRLDRRIRRLTTTLAVIATVGMLALAGILAHTHAYGNTWTPLDDGRDVYTNAGVVLWDCGPGIELLGTPGFFTEEECR